MDGIPPTLVVPIVTAIATVIAGMIAQWGARSIQLQRRQEAREGKELDISDRAAERVSREQTELRTDMKARIEKLEALVDRLRDETEACKRREMTWEWKNNMLEFQNSQLRDEANRMRAHEGLPPISAPPPPPAPAGGDPIPPRDQPPVRPVDAPSGPPPDQPPPTVPPRRDPPRH